MSGTSFVPVSRRRILGGLAALAPARAWTARPAAACGVVTMLGDSITAGFGLPEQAALPAQLRLALARLGVRALVRGAGVSGDTAADGAARVDFSVRPDTSVVVVALGGNDLLQGVDPRVTRANLDQILQRLRQRRITAVLAGVAAPPELGRSYARDFDAIFPALARARGVALYPDLLAGVARNPTLNQGDGIHPNARGVLVIAARLAPLVARALSGQR
jgi:acyl-CoA thioesterase-1